MNYHPYLEEYTVVDTPLQSSSRVVPGWQRMAVILLFITLIVPLLLAVKPDMALSPAVVAESAAPAAGTALLEAAAPPLATPALAEDPALAEASAPPPALASGISPVFSPEVQYWGPRIVEWANAHGVDPNQAATIMQVESCGDPGAISSAGAQGLFQVMPFHFAAGENSLDPDTNARRGLTYFAERLVQTSGDVGRAFAGYNGGQRAAGTTWDNWYPETQRYYIWTTGIYGDIQQGLEQSPTLQKWMEASGLYLCRQAAERIGLQ